MKVGMHMVSLTVAAAMLPGAAFALGVRLSPVGSYPAVPDPTAFGEDAAETVAYDASTQTLLTTNGALGTVDVIDISDPSAPSLRVALDVTPYGDAPTDVAVSRGTAAVSVPAVEKTDNGVVVVFRVCAALEGRFEPRVYPVGPLPDALQFSPDGRKVVVANEGEPNDEYTVDPEGSVSVIDLKHDRVQTADFTHYNRQAQRLHRMGVRIFGPGASVAQDLEPENVAVSPDSKEAWVTLQENNAVAVVDLEQVRVKNIVPLGYKFHLAGVNAFDASDKDDAINLQPWPVFGMYLPDAAASFSVHRRTYYIMANEGDARDYDGFSEEARVKDLQLAPAFEQFWPGIQDKENLGRLKVTTAPPFGKTTDEDGNDIFSALFAFGGRSFSIWSDRGTLVYESRNFIEKTIAELEPSYFNSNNDENSFDSRSDDKGPEPEDVCLGQVDGMQLAFIALERQGGVMTFDVSNPNAPRYLDYANNRDFEGDPKAGTAGDLGPEDMAFIPAHQSPIGVPLLAVSNEVSVTLTLFRIDTER